MDVETAPDRLRVLPSWLLGQLTVAARRSVGAVLAESGIHRSQYALLAALEQFGPLSQITLSERSGLDRSDVVRWIDELAAAGAVERTKDPGDRRRNVVSISAQGRRLLKRLDARLRAAQDELLHRLSPRERAQLVELLSRALGVAAR